ncbi:polysaccharide biosynthesis C-terminal domain-containing protein [Haloterrigena alkaliphila]|uniref:Polysaccharide biosynthesis C-terminal domain-containing protein n=1 Tax=Haloterrigena alkaliphila TaxID=2816475 RepID=A0A8A2V9T0_9EURY|nr:polysaccharide biosynthesis C-terminal domain-containing protein [Haloterrigena alkaliphila]QSW98231.1 polysaccharide biosynthesis C-terminal domain-containing protein [Haloterrigena alkaliphila]
MQIDALRGFLSILSAKIGTLILTLAITPLLVRSLGSAQYGDYSFILSLLGLAMIIINAGINDGIRKFVAEDRSGPTWESNVFGYYTRQGALLASIGAIFFLVLSASGIVGNIIGHRFEYYLYLVAILIFGRQFSSIIRSSLMGKGLEHISEPLLVVEKMMFAFIGLSLAIIGYGVTGVLIGHILASTFATIIGLYYISDRYNLHSIFRNPPEGFPKLELLTFNLYSIVLIFLMNSLYNVDIILLQPLAGSTATGYYKASLLIAEFLWFVPIAAQTALLHSTSEMWTKRDLSEITDIAARVTRFTILFTLLLAIGIAALADHFVPLYFGKEFTESIIPLLLLLPGALGFAIARPIFAIGQGKGELRPLIIATGLAALINLLLNIILIPRYSMIGAAVATSIGYGSMLIFHGIVARKIGYDPFADLRFVRLATTSVSSALLIFGISFLIKSAILSLIVVPPVGLIIYLVIAVRTRTIDHEEVLPLVSRIPEPFSKWILSFLHHISHTTGEGK